MGWLTTTHPAAADQGPRRLAAAAAWAARGLARAARLLGEVGLWINGVFRFDFDEGQFEQQHAWFGELGVSYHVGMYGFSLWLVGLSVVVAPPRSPCGLGGRDRARGWFG